MPRDQEEESEHEIEPTAEHTAQHDEGHDERHDDVALDETGGTHDTATAAAAKSSDTSWARTRRTALEKTSSHIHAQRIALTADARMVVGTLKASRDIFDKFEKRYAKAKVAFEEGIGKQLEAATGRRESLEAMFELFLGLAPEAKLIKAMVHVHEVAERVGNWMTITHAKPINAYGKPATGPAKAIASDKTRLSWRPLVEHAIDSFDAFVKTTDGLDTLDTAVDLAIRDLSKVLDGDAAAADLDARSRELVDVSLPGATGAFPDAIAFLLDVTAKLDAPTRTDIERRLAEQWISELARDQVTDAITDAQPYLEEIGAIGAKSSKGLRIDPHGDEWIDATTDTEQLMIWVRAQVKVEAEESVGKTVRWMGGISNGTDMIGSVMLDGNHVRAVGRAESPDGPCLDKPVTASAGGRVKIVEARWLSTPIEVTSNWVGRGVKDYLSEMRLSQVELVVEGTATTGTEIVGDDYHGPEMSTGTAPGQE